MPRSSTTHCLPTVLHVLLMLLLPHHLLLLVHRQHCLHLLLARLLNAVTLLAAAEAAAAMVVVAAGGARCTARTMRLPLLLPSCVLLLLCVPLLPQLLVGQPPLVRG